MDLKIRCRPNIFYLSPCIRRRGVILLNQTHPNLVFLPLPRYKRRKSTFRVSASVNPEDGSAWTRFSRSIRDNFGDSLKKETGFDLQDVNAKLSEFVGGIQDSVLKGQTQFWTWNEWQRWKDINNWEPARVGALALYVLVMVVTCQRIYMAIRAPFLDRQIKQASEAYMEALIPEPSPTNIRKYKKGLWRKSMPKGLKMKKFIEGPDGTLIHDSSYVGEDAWEDDATTSKDKVMEIIDHDVSLNTEDKRDLQEELGLSDVNQESRGTWQERLQIWKEILRKEQLAEQLDSSRSRYAIEFDMEEVEKSFREDARVKAEGTEGARALWISK